MMEEKDQATASDGEFDNSLVKDVGNVLSDSADYAKSKLSLAAVEAKVAIFSIVMMLILALFALIVLCGAWALLCYALSQWLVLAGYMTVIQSACTIALLNILTLAILGLIIKSLANSLRFDNSLQQ